MEQSAEAGAQFTVRVHVTLKPVVNDPQGLAARDALRHLGYAAVQAVRIGKVIDVELTAAGCGGGAGGGRGDDAAPAGQPGDRAVRPRRPPARAPVKHRELQIRKLGFERWFPTIDIPKAFQMTAEWPVTRRATTWWDAMRGQTRLVHLLICAGRSSRLRVCTSQSVREYLLR